MRVTSRVLAFVIVGTARAATVDDLAHRANDGLRTVVRKLSSPALAGRDNGTPGSLDAQTFLVRKLKRIAKGLAATETGNDAYKQPFTQGPQTGTNLLAVIPGSDLAEEYVMIGAHYDHLDSRSAPSGHCSANGTPGGEICNGATDNAAGVAIVLATGKAIAKLKPRRSVILALWDSEEDGLVGSGYYVNHPLVPNASLKGYVNLDIQGANLLPSVKRSSFAVGSETGGAALQQIAAQAIAAEGLDTKQVSYIFGQLRSDYAILVSAGVPTVFYSDSTNGCYHTTADDLGIVDFAKLKLQSHIAFRTVAALAQADPAPPFVPPSPALAVYDDAVAVGALIDAAQTDAGLFGAGDQALLASATTTVHAMIDDGPAGFDSNDALTLLGIAADLIGALGRVPCRKF